VDNDALERASLLATSVLVLAVLALLFLHDLLATGVPGLAVQGLAALLMLWARLTLGRRSFHAAATPTAGGVIATGPYRYWRHPIYASILYFLWAGVASHRSTLTVGLALLASAALGARMVTEERLMAARYPDYAPYAARTKRIIPFVV
jgi:protein-S-isoprenylcysteine O-methyltransferase Ste14